MATSPMKEKIPPTVRSSATRWPTTMTTWAATIFTQLITMFWKTTSKDRCEFRSFSLANMQNVCQFSSSIFRMKLSLCFCLQWVLLQPGQLGTRLFPAEEDGSRGLSAHWTHCQFPPSAGPHHQHRPHCRSKHIFLPTVEGNFSFKFSSLELYFQKYLLTSLLTLRKLHPFCRDKMFFSFCIIFSPARLWRTVKKSKWLTWRSVGKRTHWSGLFQAWLCQTRPTLISLNLSTVLSLYRDRWRKSSEANSLHSYFCWNLKTSPDERFINKWLQW